MGGVKQGFKHNWNYTTKTYKEKPNGNFTQYQSKGRNSPAPYGSGMPTRSKLLWKINGNFYVKRIGKNKYVRITDGLKSQGGFKLPYMKRMKYTTKYKKKTRRGFGAKKFKTARRRTKRRTYKRRY